LKRNIAVVAARAARPARPIHPVHAVLLTCSFPLFLGGLLADIAYTRTYQAQWINLAAWLIAGAMVFAGLALAWSLVEAARSLFRERRALIGLVLLAVIFVLGLLDSFMHARDAWGAMPSGLVLSLLVTALAAAAVWFSVLSPRTDHTP
jgi:uncharacterized membrane protein